METPETRNEESPVQGVVSMSEWLSMLIGRMEDDGDFWKPEAVVEIELTEEKLRNYPDHSCCRIKGDERKLLYMRQNEEEPFGHLYVWQTTGFCEDDFSGWLLFPLPDGKYLKVSYSC